MTPYLILIGSNDNEKIVLNNCKTNTDNTDQLVSNNSNAVPNMLNQSENRTAETDDENHEPLMSDIVLLEHELEMLHISRQDNPYLQLLTSQDNLDRDNGDKTDSSSMFSPEPPCSPGNRSCDVGGNLFNIIFLILIFPIYNNVISVVYVHRM